MVEPEVAFNDLNDDMDLAEDFLEYIVHSVLNDCMPELKVLERDITKTPECEKTAAAHYL